MLIGRSWVHPLCIQSQCEWLNLPPSVNFCHTLRTLARSSITSTHHRIASAVFDEEYIHFHSFITTSFVVSSISHFRGQRAAISLLSLVLFSSVQRREECLLYCHSPIRSGVCSRVCTYIHTPFEVTPNFARTFSHAHCVWEGNRLYPGNHHFLCFWEDGRLDTASSQMQ